MFKLALHFKICPPSPIPKVGSSAFLPSTGLSPVLQLQDAHLCAPSLKELPKHNVYPRGLQFPGFGTQLGSLQKHLLFTCETQAILQCQLGLAGKYELGQT